MQVMFLMAKFPSSLPRIVNTERSLSGIPSAKERQRREIVVSDSLTIHPLEWKANPMDERNQSPSLQPDHTAEDRDARVAKREREAKRHEKLDDALDRALEESFPGSDPVSVAQPPQSVHDKHDRQKR
jgi:hypothetical protein